MTDHTTTIGFHDPLDSGDYPDPNVYAARQAVALERIAVALEGISAVMQASTGHPAPPPGSMTYSPSQPAILGVECMCGHELTTADLMEGPLGSATCPICETVHDLIDDREIDETGGGEDRDRLPY